MQLHGALRDELSKLAVEGAPQAAMLAAWILDRPEEVAFKSVRGLANSAKVSSNTVVRLAQALGYDGYDAFRAAFQAELLQRTMAYSARAAALRSQAESDLEAALREAHAQNAAAMFSPEMSRLTDECADRLVRARRVHAIGVRSCLSVSHYLSYVGSMAFPNIAPSNIQPGAFIDALAETTEEDVVVAITFKHYSREVVRSCEIARERGATLISITDSQRSPIAVGAWRVLPLAMAGPQFMPSLVTAFLLIEILLAKMTLRAPDAAKRIEAFEQRVMRAGGYVADG